ncbi:MAG: Ig-like domain-containing protein, partial [Longimicrobiales bacterium]
MNLVSALLLAAAFQQAAPTPEVRIEPSNPRVEVDQTVDLNAVLVDENGERDSVDETRVRWFVVEGNAVEIDPLGRVVGVEPGRARIAAVTGQAVGFTEVVVPDLPATRIELSLPEEPLLSGTSAPLTVVGTDRLGGVVDDSALTFRSSDPSVAGVDEAGRVFARAPGSARIEASSATADASLDVEVAPAEGLAFDLRPGSSSVRTGDVLRFQVSARPEGSSGSSGEARPLRPAWSVTGAGAAIHEEGTDGVFVAEEAGRYRVTA